MLRQPSIPRREARSASPRRRTGRPDDSSTWTRPLTTPTSSTPLWAKGTSTVADRGRGTGEGTAGGQQHLDEATNHADQSDALRGEGALEGRRSRQGDEVGAHARLGVVEQREDRARGRVAETVPPADPVVRGDLTAEQLVEGDVESPGKGHQRLEGEPSFSPLHLGDGAGGDPGEAGEITLAQIPAQAVGAQRRTDARRCLGRLQLQLSVLDGVAEQLSLSSRRAPLGLADAQAALAD